MTSKRRRYLLICLAVVAVSAPATAEAVSVLRSYSGSDYSVNSSNGKALDACDREGDGHAVKGEFYRGGESKKFEVVNKIGVGNCARISVPTVIFTHRIVEIVPLSRDDYGPYVFPS